MQLSVAGQTLSGDFAFEQSSTTNPSTGVTRTATRVVAQNVSLRLGGGGTDVVVLTNGRGFVPAGRVLSLSSRNIAP